jgi:hypothetical protein
MVDLECAEMRREVERESLQPGKGDFFLEGGQRRH